MKCDFRQFDDRVEIWGPDDSTGVWFHMATFDEDWDFYTEALCTVDLDDLEEIAAWAAQQRRRQ